MGNEKLKNLTFFQKILVILSILGVGGGAYAALPLGSRLALDKCTPFATGTSTPITTTNGTNRYVEENNAFFITANATSTFECSLGNADFAALNLFFVGSTTAAYPTWDYQYSFDGNEWYNATRLTNRADFSSTNVSTSTLGFAYGVDGAAAGNGTTTISIPIDPLGYSFIRIRLGAGGGAGSVYPELIRRNQN